jgi:hypothetical protein
MNELRNRQVTTYLTATEYQLLREQADAGRVTVSALTGSVIAEWLADRNKRVTPFMTELPARLGKDRPAQFPELDSDDPPEWPDEFGRGAHYDASFLSDGAKS